MSVIACITTVYILTNSIIAKTQQNKQLWQETEMTHSVGFGPSQTVVQCSTLINYIPNDVNFTAVMLHDSARPADEVQVCVILREIEERQC